MDFEFENYLKGLTNAKQCTLIEEIQSLWSGYGYVARYQIDNGDMTSVVVKCIQLEHSNTHPRGWHTSIGHQRKLRSYDVETYWYKYWSKSCGMTCKVPKCIGALEQGHKRWIILEDLQVEYPLVKQQIAIEEVGVCLQWLANFHARFLNTKPEGLWEIGTYWHLETRPEEFEKMEDDLLKSKAHEIDKCLNQCQFQTIVHGDAKLANFCFSEDGRRVAAVDFQYVGGGCGMKDVAYFLGSCLSGDACAYYENDVLDYYFECLRTAVSRRDVKIDINALEKEWREMYLIASVDFTRFLLGWMPTHNKLNTYTRKIMETVLSKI
ncbi:MAG: DUF1679 domain-containing protein [Flavobacteriaceae bacterium]|nr:DUF1679 domain-containing protein [Flavobacteriaceae bacterium]